MVNNLHVCALLKPPRLISRFIFGVSTHYEQLVTRGANDYLNNPVLGVELKTQARHTGFPSILGCWPLAASRSSEMVLKRLPRKRSMWDSSAQVLKVGTTLALPGTLVLGAAGVDRWRAPD